MDKKYIETWRKRVEDMDFDDLYEEFRDWRRNVDERFYEIGRDLSRCGGKIDEKLQTEIEHAQEDDVICTIMHDLLITKYKKEWDRYLRQNAREEARE